MRAAIVLSLATAVLVRAQESSLVSSAVAPAATVVDTPVEASVELFTEEKEQITEDVISALLANENTADVADLFAFADTEVISEPERRRRMRRTLRCKSAPGDILWPSSFTWGVFDLLLGGALEKVVPIASVCYPQSEFNNYNAAKCAAVTNGFGTEDLHFDSDHSIMSPLYQGGTCKPGTGKTASDTCTLGGYSSYSIHVRNVAQIQLAVNFARSLNIRLVIKNTGHDYNGRSTGKNALSLWTHNLKSIDYIKNYRTSSYNGPVFKVGAGVQGFELYEAAERYGVTAVAGICKSVGVFGGYVTGGGHGPVMQLFGMGADQILEMQVVTADGRFRTVSQTKHSDLYWAMLGGGGGTFGIITSAVVKVHPRIPVTTSMWSFVAPAHMFWPAARFFWDEMPKYNAAKTYSSFSFMKLAPGLYLFNMTPFFATNMTIAQFEALTAPFFAKLASLGIQYDIDTKYHTSFYPAYQATFAPIDWHVGSDAATPGNRLIPAENWDTEAARNTTFAAIQHAVDNAFMVSLYHQAPNANIPQGLNSVNPAFRNQASQLIAINQITDFTPTGLAAAMDDLTNNVMAPLRAATPNGGSYGNEADPAEPNWQQQFWGSNYPRLLTVKQKWDPTGLFYVHHGVGSEGWVVEDGLNGIASQGLTQNGRLCRA